MATMAYVKPERLSLRLHPEFNERWVQQLIAEDPSILGLGELVLRDKERSQPRAGRLDLLLQNPDTGKRFEVEIQLGKTDEAHIIRTIEYWDIERKRYPQYDHCAVLVAEDITSRFLNVISLFNGTLPIVALQMQALAFGANISLVFTKVIDELSRGLIDEDEDVQAAPADRAYWEKKGSKDSLILVDEVFSVCKEIDPSLDLNYTRSYITTTRAKSPFNFIYLRPRRNSLNFQIRLEKTEEIDALIQQSGFEQLTYETRDGYYKLSLVKADIREKLGIIRYLIDAAYKYRAG
jgi:hypothetical protein